MIEWMMLRITFVIDIDLEGGCMYRRASSDIGALGETPRFSPVTTLERAVGVKLKRAGRKHSSLESVLFICFYKAY